MMFRDLVRMQIDISNGKKDPYNIKGVHIFGKDELNEDLKQTCRTGVVTSSGVCYATFYYKNEYLYLKYTYEN